METKVKNREWVKDAAIIFLVVLLILTFFSNTIMNRTLPEVATAEVTNGAIVAKVRGSGTVTANGKHQVKAKEIRTIRSVMIKAGQEVNAGDVLFVLGEGDATALEQAKETLRNLQTNYQRTALSTPVFDYSSYNRAIESAENAYQRAYNNYDEALKQAQAVNNPVAEAAKNRYEEARRRAEQLERDYAERKDARIQELNIELDALNTQKSQLEQAAEDAHQKMLIAEAALTNIQEQISYWEAEKQRLQEVFDVISDPGSGATVDERQIASANLTNAIDTLSSYTVQLPAAEQAYNEAAAEYDAALGGNYQTILNDISACEEELRALQNDELHYEEVRAAIELRDKLYEEYMAQIGSAAYELREAEYALTDAGISLQSAYDSLAVAQENNARTAASTGVELSSIQQEIALQQEKIKSLAGDEENVITANVSGTVDTVDCTAGDTVLKDALLCTIEVPDMGHTLTFSVTNDQAQRLRIGDTATISNYYWGNSVTATLTTIRTDPKNPQTNKVLTFDLVGDVTSGAEMTISVGQKSANYDIIVPNSAIKSDNNGSFVLVVQVKSSPLGNRYTAKRVSVEVLANDDNNSAVVADLNNGDYVITTSSSPVSSGDMVRIADNQT